MNKITFIAIALSTTLISGCGTVGSLRFVDQSKHVYIGEFNTYSRKMSVEIDGVKYEGFFITNSGNIGNIVYSGNSGKAILNAVSGDTMRCDFDYDEYHAIGTCLNSNGNRYQVATQ
jgi:hypothetical protein